MGPSHISFAMRWPRCSGLVAQALRHQCKWPYRRNGGGTNDSPWPVRVDRQTDQRQAGPAGDFDGSLDIFLHLGVSSTRSDMRPFSCDTSWSLKCPPTE